MVEATHGTNLFRLRGLAPVLKAGVVLLVFGCGQADTGPRKYEVTGKVIYDGKPLTMGRVTFVPDSDRGNSGPPGYAIVQNGQFDTASKGGRHSVSGPITVLITGYGEPDSNGNFPEVPEFFDHPVPAEIDAKQRRTSLDFEVPKVESKKKKK